jgi:hypothetical protein
MKYYYSAWRDISAVNIAGDWIALRNTERIDTSDWEQLSIEDAPTEAIEALVGRVTLPAEDIFPELAKAERTPYVALAA